MDWEASKQRHDRLLEEFRARSARVRAIHLHGEENHAKDVALSAAIRKRQADFVADAESAALQRQRRHARRVAQAAHKSLDEADENLKRLGLDGQSMDQQKQVSMAVEMHPRPQHMAVVVPDVPVDDAVSGRASAYSKKSRKGAGQPGTSTVPNAHPLVGGVASLLKNTNSIEGLAGANPYAVAPPNRQQSHQRVKLATARTMYPTTVRPAGDEAASASDGEGDIKPSDLVDSEQSAAYVAAIHAKKAEDVLATKERQVRHHRLRAEQAKSRSEIAEKKELETRLMAAHCANASDKQEALDRMVRTAIDVRVRHTSMTASIVNSSGRSLMAAVQSGRGAVVARQEWWNRKSEHDTLRRAQRCVEESEAQTKHALKADFCESLVRASVDLAMGIITRSTQCYPDGTVKYTRAALGEHEWNMLRHKALRQQAAAVAKQPDEPASASRSPSATAATPKIGRPQSAQLAPAWPGDPVLANAGLGVDASDIAALLEGQQTNLSGKAPSANPDAIFVWGDATISGTTLLEQFATPIVSMDLLRQFCVVTPNLLRHLDFEHKQQLIDNEIQKLLAQRTELSVDLRSSPGSAQKGTRKEPKPKDTTANAAPSSALNDINSRLAQLQNDRAALFAEAALMVKDRLDEGRLGGLLGQLLAERQASSSGTAPYADPTVLTMDLVCKQSPCRPPTIILAGFPFASAPFWEALRSVAASAATRFRCVALTLDVAEATLLKRLDERQLFWKSIVPGTAPSLPIDDNSKKKKGGAKSELTVPTEPPRKMALISHPIFSPLATPTDAHNTQATLGGAFSPYATHLAAERSASDAIFVRRLSWRDEANGKDVPFLHKIACRDVQYRPPSGGPLTFAYETLLLDDDPHTVGCTVAPGQECVPCDPTILGAIAKRLGETVCRAALASNGEIDDFVSPDNDLRSSAENMLVKTRSAFAACLEHLEGLSSAAQKYLSDEVRCYPTSLFHSQGGSFERLHACDEQRKADTAALAQLFDRASVNVQMQVSSIERDVEQFVAQAMERLPALSQSTADQLRAILIGRPVKLLTIILDHIRLAMSHWCAKLFAAFSTEGHDGALRPKSVDEFLAQVSPFQGVPREGDPTWLQTVVMKHLMDMSFWNGTPSSERAYCTFKALSQTIQPRAPSLLPACVGRLPPRQPYTCPEHLALALAFGEPLGTRIAPPNSLEMCRCARELSKLPTPCTPTDIVKIPWWFPEGQRWNVAVLLATGELDVPLALSMICGTGPKNDIMVFKRYQTCLAAFLGLPDGAEVTVPHANLDAFFSPGTFSLSKLAIISYLHPATPRDAVALGVLPRTPFGRSIIDEALGHLAPFPAHM